MLIGLSERLIQNLVLLAEAENKKLPAWKEKKFIADCNIPTVSGTDDIHYNIAVVAPVSAGKSTLFNALCGYPILPVASGVTSAAPTYINRANTQNDECVTVYSIKKVTDEEKGTVNFVRDEKSKKTFRANDISDKMFADLLDYMYFVTHGDKDGNQYQTTVENVAYFMKTPELSDILFNGDNAKKKTIKKEDYALEYSNTRHRFMLLLILLCVYVNQNEDNEGMSVYTKALNELRNKLFKKYKLPVGKDYCVCLDWCSDDIPKNGTLIDLPGTGADTKDSEKQSSHTKLVRGILEEADAVWVLCSDNGVVDPDLMYALKDTLEGDKRKNKVCIYNSKGNPNDATPVVDFLHKLTCLTGERCYVVDALAGEYRFVQNGVNSLMTKTASNLRAPGRGSVFATLNLSEEIITNGLKALYEDENSSAYCTFTTFKDSGSNIVAKQDTDVRYTLNTFFKSALAEYLERLKYEIALTDAIKQSDFYIYVRDSLDASRIILEGVNGNGEQITNAVKKSLAAAMEKASDAYVEKAAENQKKLAKKLEALGETINENIKAPFEVCLSSLIGDIKDEWRKLLDPTDENGLTNILGGNYSLKASHPNWQKFVNVRTNANEKVNLDAFSGAINIADGEVKKYKNLLNEYINELKQVTNEFANDYLNTFLVAFDEESNKILGADNNAITDDIVKNFAKTRNSLEDSLSKQLKALCVKVCNSFNVLIEPDGIFDQLCVETDKIFRNKFLDKVLDNIRDFMYDTFTGTNYRKFFRDCLRPKDLNRILNDDFPEKEAEYQVELSKIIDEVYGSNGGTAINFPANISSAVNQFNGDKITNGANTEIKNTNETIISLVEYGAKQATDLKDTINELDNAIAAWATIGKEHFSEIESMLVECEGENTKKLYNDLKGLLEIINNGNKNGLKG